MCAEQIQEEALVCRYCGHDFRAGTATNRPTKTNGLAIASLVFGIFPVFGVGALLAVIFGHVSIGQIKRSDGAESGRGMAIAGLILGYLWIALFVGLLAIVALGSTTSDSFGSASSEYGEPQVQGQLPPMPPDAAVDTSATGDTAPIVIGTNFDGNEVRIENDGRAKAIVLLSHWCPHCQNEVPDVQAWLDSGGGVEGVDLYSVSTATHSTRDNYPPSEWFQREGWTVPVIVDDQESSVYRSFGAGGFPFWVFVNSDGTVAARAAGRLGIEQLEQFMNGLS
jgi:thiol-disulfide isomerase/thioredoxin